MANFKKNLLTEMRTVLINGQENAVNDESLVRAMTINEELKALGFTLAPKDIIRLAKQEHPEEVLKTVQDEYSHKGYKPMYPDFPNQVLNMDDATFRFHQMVHYFSTYDTELLFGVEVKNGWMPDVKETEKTKEDKTLLNAKVLSLANEKEAQDKVIAELMNKKERWTPLEAQLAADVASKRINDLIQIPFKENIYPLYMELRKPEILDKIGRDGLVNAISKTISNSDDVLKLVEARISGGDSINKFRKIRNASQNYNVIGGGLGRNDTRSHEKIRLSTAERKDFLKMLENNFSAEEIRFNLAEHRERNVNIMDALSATKKNFLKNPENVESVRALRNKELRSFKSLLEEKLNNKTEDALDFYAKRPGEMLRGVGRLYRLGYDEKDIFNALKDKNFKFQTLLSNVNAFANETGEWIGRNYGNNTLFNSKATPEERAAIFNINHALLKNAMTKLDTPLKNKYVFNKEGDYSFENAAIHTNDKSEAGGYGVGSTTFQLDKDSGKIRFFCFWNDQTHRKDIDMHALAFKEDGSHVHIGWCGDYKTSGIVFSGDITTSNNSAEYIDIDIKKAKEEGVRYVSFELNCFNFHSFSKCPEVYTGILDIDKVTEDIKQYNPKNLMYHHDLTQMNVGSLNYGVIDIQEGTFRMLSNDETYVHFHTKPNYSVKHFLNDLYEAQNVKVVDDENRADIIIRMDKGTTDREISLIDKNYFMPTGNTKTVTENKERYAEESDRIHEEVTGQIHKQY